MMNHGGLLRFSMTDTQTSYCSVVCSSNPAQHFSGQLTILLQEVTDTSLQKSQYAKIFDRINRSGVRHL